MTLIEISDLNPVGSSLFADPKSFLSELQTTETGSIRGGDGQVSFSIDGGNPEQSGNRFRITGSIAGNQISRSISSENFGQSGNFFYTNSGSVPVGAVPIPGFPGAYTF
jgi:hypothetical protein